MLYPTLLGLFGYRLIFLRQNPFPYKKRMTFANIAKKNEK